MRKYSATLAAIIIVAMIISFINGAEFSVDAIQSSMENKTTYSFTEDKTYTDDCIFVVMNAEASTQFKSYSPADFPEVACKKVTDLSLATGERVKRKIACAVNSARKMEPLDEIQLNGIIDIDIADYRQMLCLELEVNGKQNVIDAVHSLETRADVCYVAPNSTASLEDDVDYVVSLEEPTSLSSNEQWAHATISLAGAWSYNTGSSEVRVAVLDTGIDSTHSDLSKRINKGRSKNFLNGQTGGVYEPNPSDPDGHGTHVAGIIGAYGNTISGVCWNVELVSYRVLDSQGNGTLLPTINAIYEATNSDVDIINMSYKIADHNLLRYAIQSFPGLVICAACNTSSGSSPNNDIDPKYPANYNYLSNVITVGASDQSDSKASFSCYGQSTVDLFAPGADILSCYPSSQCTSGTCGGSNNGHYSNGYHKASGTSMAAPHVAGVAALLLSENSSLTAAQVKGIIMDSVSVVYNSYGTSQFGTYCVSGGRLNAQAAMTIAIQDSDTTLTHQQLNTSSINVVQLAEMVYLVPSNKLYINEDE